MRNGKRGRYTLEFKLEAVRLVESGQSIAEAARSLGVVEQTLSNWSSLQGFSQATDRDRSVFGLYRGIL
jgi:transposase-like protein